MHHQPAIEFDESGNLYFHSLGDSLLEGCPVDETQGHAVMQFTGLRDKVSREIYEGDIVRHEYYPADPEHGTAKEIETIAYAGDGFGFKRGDEVIRLSDCMSLTNNQAKDLEVIGNVYENSELLSLA